MARDAGEVTHIEKNCHQGILRKHLLVRMPIVAFAAWRAFEALGPQEAFDALKLRGIAGKRSNSMAREAGEVTHVVEHRHR